MECLQILFKKMEITPAIQRYLDNPNFSTFYDLTSSERKYAKFLINNPQNSELYNAQQQAQQEGYVNTGGFSSVTGQELVVTPTGKSLYVLNKYNLPTKTNYQLIAEQPKSFQEANASPYVVKYPFFQGKQYGSSNVLTKKIFGEGDYYVRPIQPDTRSFGERFNTTLIEDIKTPFSSKKNTAITIGSSLALAGLSTVALPASLFIAGGFIGSSTLNYYRQRTPESLADLTITTASTLGGYVLGKGLSYGYKGLNYAFKYPKYSSIVLSETTLNTGSDFQTYARVQTTKTNLFQMNTKYLSDVYVKGSSNNFDSSFIVKDFKVGQVKMSKGVSMFTGKNVYTKPSGFAGIGYSMGSTKGEITSQISISKFKFLGTKYKSQYSFSPSVSTRSGDITSSIGRTIPMFTTTNGLKLSRSGRGVFGGIDIIKTSPELDTGYASYSGGSRTTITRNNIISSVETGVQGFKQTNLGIPKLSAVYQTKSKYTPTFKSNQITITRTRTRTLTRNYFTPVQMLNTKTKTNSLFKFGNVQIFKPTTYYATRFNLGSSFYIPSAQTQNYRQGTRLNFRFNAPNNPAPFVPTIPTNFTPRFNLNLGYNDFGTGSNIYGGGNKITRYTPSFSALIFRIYGRARKGGKLSKSGLNFRPITSDIKY